MRVAADPGGYDVIFADGAWPARYLEQGLPDHSRYAIFPAGTRSTPDYANVISSLGVSRAPTISVRSRPTGECGVLSMTLPR